MSNHQTFKSGVIEGFFGRSWSWQTRNSYAEFLSENGFDSYIYAPKSDHFFRKQWHRNCPREHLQNLQQLAQTYQSKKLDFGIGLSPFELYRDFNQDQQQLLKNKLAEIDSIACNTLCILFDDMQGDFPGLAQQQADIIHFVAEHSRVDNLIMCPTYYSYDPSLITHFGEMPDHYLEDLGVLLDSEIEIFWTGPNVFSKEFPINHLQELAEKLQRKPLIWDNYPVNDSQKLSSFLHLRAYENRSSQLMEHSCGHIANPMNQAALSQIPLYSLPRIYELKEDYQPEVVFIQACHSRCGGKLGQLIINDIELFQDIGLEGMSKKEKEDLTNKYAQYKSDIFAKEIIDWLEGKYAFDPACLT